MSSSRPSWPWLVKGSSATSVSRPSCGKRFFSSRTARGTRPSGLVASTPSGVFSAGSMTGKQRHHRHAQRHALLGHGEQAVDAAPLHAGHAGHVLRLAVAVEHEHGQDQVGRGQAVLAHQVAREGIAAQAARAAGGKGRGCDQARSPAPPVHGAPERPGRRGARVFDLLKWLMNDSREAVIPCFSSLSRCLGVMTAIRLAGPGLVSGPFFQRSPVASR